MEWIQWLFLPPRFGEPERNRQGGVLHVLLWVALALCVVAAVVFWVRGRGEPPHSLLELYGVPGSLAGAALCGAAHYFLRQGHIKSVGSIFLASTWAIVSVLAFITGGYRSQVTWLFVPLVFSSGLMLNNRAVLSVSVGAVTTLSVLLWAETNQRIGVAAPNPTAVALWRMQMVNILLSAGLVMFALSALQEAGRMALTNARALSKTTFKLNERKAYIDNILRSMADMLVVTDQHGAIQRVNPALTQNLGYRVDELIGENYLQMLIDSGNGSANSLEAVQLGYDDKAEVGYRCADGTILPVQVSRAPLLMGRQKGYVWVARDITERKKSEEAMRNALYTAEAANRAKSQFLANMSHELRTPLNAILGYGEMVREELEDLHHSSLVNDMQHVLTSGQHLLAMISSILDMSRLESGKMGLYVERFDLVEQLRDLERTTKPLVEQNRNVFRMDLAGSVPEMYTDLTKLRQILLNLISNAAKFTEGGEITLTTSAFTRDGEAYVQISVTDTGIGIDEESLKHLFRPFTQADSSSNRKYGGTGLGLGLSRRFAQMMKGEISVVSTLGVGSTFTLFVSQDLGRPNPQDLYVEDISEDPTETLDGEGLEALLQEVGVAAGELQDGGGQGATASGDSEAVDPAEEQVNTATDRDSAAEEEESEDVDNAEADTDERDVIDDAIDVDIDEDEEDEDTPFTVVVGPFHTPGDLKKGSDKEDD